VSGRVLTGSAMNAMNTFDAPNTVRPTSLDAVRIENGNVIATLPARSVTVLAID